ncbi:MAG: guanine deaminase [Alphaproteobacteria bacterium]|nr:guanine deaminase [Alphaproteobacteria bacterium]
MTQLRGRFLCPAPSRPTLDVMDDALVTVGDDGRIAQVQPAPPACPLPETRPGCVLMPGFVDTHVHFPQTRILGSASGPLLPWLERSVFPEEARFADRAYAEAVAEQFCAALARWGTTAASIYSSSHPGATDVLFAALDRWGLRAQVGLTLMNQGAPEALLLDTGPAMEASEALIERWHGAGRLRFCVTPRFALSCTPELLRAAARLAERHALPVQTHLSENLDELDATARAFPGHRDYLAVYEAHGLVGPRSLFAHCIHLSDGEWGRMADADVAVAHCPDSNFFLGSGCMPLAPAVARGLRVGLGTDVGAGRAFSLRRVVASAYDAALVLRQPVSAEDLLWRATRGGALALDPEARFGCVAPGYDADLIAISMPEGLSGVALLDALAFRRDDGPVAAVWLQGRLLKT